MDTPDNDRTAKGAQLQYSSATGNWIPAKNELHKMSMEAYLKVCGHSTLTKLQFPRRRNDSKLGLRKRRALFNDVRIVL